VPQLSGFLTLLTTDVFTDDMDTLALIRLGWVVIKDSRSDFTNHVLVRTFDCQLCIFCDCNGDPLRNSQEAGMRVPQGKVENVPCQCGTKTDALENDLESRFWIFGVVITRTPPGFSTRANSDIKCQGE
jgi:hypothetical protein